MSDPIGLGDEPAEDAGQESIRLDADKTRDALESTLDELENRLKPQHLLQSLKQKFVSNPAPFIAGAVAVVGVVVGIVVLASRSKHARG